MPRAAQDHLKAPKRQMNVLVTDDERARILAASRLTKETITRFVIRAAVAESHRLLDGMDADTPSMN